MPAASAVSRRRSARTASSRYAVLRRLRGRSAIASFLNGVTANVADDVDVKPVIRHNLANVLFTGLTPREAHVSSYFTVVTHIGLDHFGRYRDTLVSAGHTLLIKHRKVSTDWAADNSVMARRVVAPVTRSAVMRRDGMAG